MSRKDYQSILLPITFKFNSAMDNMPKIYQKVKGSSRKAKAIAKYPLNKV